MRASFLLLACALAGCGDDDAASDRGSLELDLVGSYKGPCEQVAGDGGPESGGCYQLLFKDDGTFQAARLRIGGGRYPVAGTYTLGPDGQVTFRDLCDGEVGVYRARRFVQLGDQLLTFTLVADPCAERVLAHAGTYELVP